MGTKPKQNNGNISKITNKIYLVWNLDLFIKYRNTRSVFPSKVSSWKTNSSLLHCYMWLCSVTLIVLY